jgi:hypothetical protein
MDSEHVKAEAAKILPPGLHLYDFGDGIVSMPKPDFEEPQSHLISYIFYLHDDNHRFKMTEIPADTDADLLNALPGAIARFETDAWQLKPGESPTDAPL